MYMQDVFSSVPHRCDVLQLCDAHQHVLETLVVTSKAIKGSASQTACDDSASSAREPHSHGQQYNLYIAGRQDIVWILRMNEQRNRCDEVISRMYKGR